MSMDKLNAALVAALADVHEPHKGGKATTGSYGYTYMTLPDLSAVVRAAFARHGLGFTQHVTTHDGWVEVTTRVVHESGATWRTEPLAMPVAARNPQAVGSAVTYGRRYQLAALVGLSGSDDDDAHAATKNTADPVAAAHTGPPPVRNQTTPAGPMTSKQRAFFWQKAKDKGMGDKPTLQAWAAGILERSYDDLELGELTKAEASLLIDELDGVKVADRDVLTEPPADDPWQNTEQAVMAE